MTSLPHPRLDIMLATRGQSGIERVAQMYLPVIEGVRYVIAWQLIDAESDDVPSSLRRDDVDIVTSHTVGCSVNRNICLDRCTADYCLAADDDLVYTPQQILAVIDTLDAHPEVDVASFMYEGADRKWYPAEECDLTERLPKGFSSTMFEIAFRRKALIDKGVRFNENFGVGAPVLKCGIDQVFMLECRRAGLRVRFFPIVITRHEGLTTGYRPITTEGVAMGHGAYLRLAHGLMGLPRVPLFVWRNHRLGRIRLWWGLRKVLKGYFYKLK